MTSRPIRIAHRGASGSAPENTLAAFRHALELSVDLVETDVRALKDGTLALLHDATVDRTTDGEGRLADMTREEMKRLDAGSWFSPEFAGERIPTLEEALALLRGGPLLLIEMKETGLEEALIRALTETDSLGGVVIQSFESGAVRRIRELKPELPCGLLLSRPARSGSPEEEAASLLEAALACGANFVGLYGRIVAPETVSFLHRRGMSVWVWTLNEPDQIRMATESGVDGIISDRPERIGGTP